MAKRKNKELKQKDARKGKELPKTRKSTDGCYPVWIFTEIDRAGKFAFNVNREDFMHREVLDKVIHYSNMSWANIKMQTHDNRKSKHHFIPFHELSKEAQDRLKQKDLTDDSDSIFSFAFQNRLRIVGIRKNEKFYVLWYDPNHEVCPSKKQHT